jgi:chorismate-pyruvate lyase
MTGHGTTIPGDVQRFCESLLWPLNLFCDHFGREAPEITPLFPQNMPEPYRRLLVHGDDMTPTLEAYHGTVIGIERINVFRDDEETVREVILRGEGGGRPVEYGASRTFHRMLPPDALALIDEGTVPLGTVLHVCSCPHTARPSGYFKIRATPYFARVFDVPAGTSLFGRRSDLVAPHGVPIAEVCEILPVENSQRGS